jgi:site-specific DNA-methyltransferase (adenine-specific)
MVMSEQTRKVMFSNETAEWFTPPYLFDRYNQIHHFTLDPCTSSQNPLGCQIFYTKEQDGLSQIWPKGNVWINPPYGRTIEQWVERAKDHARLGKGTAVMLLPGRIDVKWFHEYIWDAVAGRPYEDVDFEPLKGRVKFLTTDDGQQSNSPAFPSMIVTFWKRQRQQAGKEKEEEEEAKEAGEVGNQTLLFSF